MLYLENVEAVFYFLRQFKTRPFLPLASIFLVSKIFMSPSSRLPRNTAFEKIKIHEKASFSWFSNLLLAMNFSSLYQGI